MMVNNSTNYQTKRTVSSLNVDLLFNVKFLHSSNYTIVFRCNLKFSKNKNVLGTYFTFQIEQQPFCACPLARTWSWISISKCHGLSCVQWFELKIHSVLKIFVEEIHTSIEFFFTIKGRWQIKLKCTVFWNHLTMCHFVSWSIDNK